MGNEPEVRQVDTPDGSGCMVAPISVSPKGILMVTVINVALGRMGRAVVTRH